MMDSKHQGAAQNDESLQSCFLCFTTQPTDMTVHYITLLHYSLSCGDVYHIYIYIYHTLRHDNGKRHNKKVSFLA